jgi:hypothetical protein
MSTQNSNNINVTGGSISGTTVSGYIPTTEKAAALGVATLDAGGTVPLSQIPASIQGGVSYQGTWNASTNTPTLTNGVGTKGYYYVVSVAGNTNLDGITSWNVGDWAIFNGTVWQKVDNTDAVTSVNGYTGTVVLTNTDVGAFPATATTGTGNVVLATGATQANPTISNYENFTPTTAPAYSEGRVWYDSSAKAVAYYNDSTGIKVHVGQDLIVKVINNTGSTIANGAPVYITGTSSGQTYPNVALAKADVAATSAVIGLTNGSITNGAIGYVTSQGGIDGVNTGTFTVGQVLYLSPFSAGQLMNTVPPTGITVQVGVVTYVDSSAGRIYVKQTTPLAVPASIITGTLAVNQGGTGATTLTGYVKGSGTSALTASGTIPTTDLSGTVTNAQLANSAITINGTSTSLGGSISVGTVTSVTGTAPVVSSGGATPAISMAAATSSVNGYLTSTDWNTFNNKGSGTVTSVSGTGTVNGISLSGTVTSSGNLTLGGTLSNVSLSTQVTGTLPIANGGTGETTRQAAMDTLAGAVTSGQYLRGNGTDVVMSAIQAADVPTLNQNTTGTAGNVTGTVAIANGGTGQTTATAAFNALNPMTTTGDIIYEASATTAARLPIGSTGQVLTVSGGIPAWTTPSTGASVSVGTSPPVSPAAGDFWWDSESGKLKIYYNDGTSAQWVDAFTGTTAGSSGGGVLMVSGGQGFSTTSTSLVDVPNLTAALTEGTWAYTVDLSFQSTGTAGTRFCMTYTGSFSNIEYTQSGMESTTADGATTRQTTSASLSGTPYGATANTQLYGRMFGTIVVTSAGNLKVQIAKATSGTSTTYPSIMTYYRVA